MTESIPVEEYKNSSLRPPTTVLLLHKIKHYYKSTSTVQSIMRFSTAALLTFFISTASSVHGTDSGIRGDNNARKEMTEQPDYMKSSAYRKQQVDEKLAATGVTYKDHNDSAYIKLKTSNTLLKLEEAEEVSFILWMYIFIIEQST